MPYVSELLIKNDVPLVDAKIRDDGEVVNGGLTGYPCRAINDLSEAAVNAFGPTAANFRAAFPNSVANDAVDLLICPILQEMPKEAYTVSDGYTYEKYLWDRWVESCAGSPAGVTSPMTREPVDEEPIRNERVVQIIEDVAGVLRAAGQEVIVGLVDEQGALGAIWDAFLIRQAARIEEIKRRLIASSGALKDSVVNSINATTFAAEATASSVKVIADVVSTGAEAVVTAANCGHK